jgi:ketosteroid isomerase-like protein
MLANVYRQGLDAFNSRDLDAWLALMDEDIEVESRFSRLGNTRFRGHRSIKRWWDDLGDAWESLDVVPEEVREVAPDETLALIHLNGRGRGSGLEVSEPAAHRVRYRNGKWLQLAYVDREAAERELAELAR